MARAVTKFMDGLRLLKGSEVEAEFGLSEGTMAQMRRQACGPPYYKLYKIPHYDVREIVRWIAESRRLPQKMDKMYGSKSAPLTEVLEELDAPRKRRQVA